MTIHHILHGIFLYYVALHGLYLMLILIGATQLRRHSKGISFGEFQRIANSPLTLPMSVIMPAFNEEVIIAETVLCAIKLRYPQHEVVVVNDGSTDNTLAVLIERFNMRRVDKVGQKRIQTKEVFAVYESADYPTLVVIDKANGRRGDAINAGACYARYPLLCIIDADSVVEPDGLLRMARPFLKDASVVAAGGVVWPMNGMKIEDGHIVGFELPRNMLALNQMVEYARSFHWARNGLAKLKSMLCISGAFTLVKKEVFIALGGTWGDSITDDIEFTIRLNRLVYDRKNPQRQRIAYVPDAICYTEVPDTLRQYASQRNRWQRGTLQALFRSAGMFFNPRYGLTGLFGMPFFLFFEALSAVVETASYVLIAVVLLMGIATTGEILLFLYLAFVLGTFLSLAAVLLKESTRLRTANRADLQRLVMAVFLDNLGYHQMHLLVRFVGTFDYLIRRRVDLGQTMARKGSGAPPRTQPAPS
jgi:cellulose synthase/poly-beta-1,6-N-acetylglucosamine synthase-like glycosyltransferase